MKNRYLLGMITVAVVALVGQTAFAKLPSWDTVNDKPARFKLLKPFNSEAVLDVETGLVWELTPGTAPVTWQTANAACILRVVDNRMGWRLPTIQELTSLVDPSVSDPSLPVNHPFQGVTGSYWSATSSGVTDAWAVSFNNGIPVPLAKSGTVPSTWCVRGQTGSGVDSQ